MRDCCVDRPVNAAVSDLCHHRTEAKEDECIVQRHTEQSFYIPQLHIEEAMARMAAISDNRTAIQQLQAVHDRRAQRREVEEAEAKAEESGPPAPAPEAEGEEVAAAPERPDAPPPEDEGDY